MFWVRIRKKQISPAHPITITIVWDIIHYPHKENRIKLFDSIQREMLRKSNYVLFKFQANLLILKNLLRIGPARYCNICKRGLKLPETLNLLCLSFSVIFCPSFIYWQASVNMILRKSKMAFKNPYIVICAEK